MGNFEVFLWSVKDLHTFLVYTSTVLLLLLLLYYYYYYYCSGLSTGIYTTNLPEACFFVADSAQCNVIVVEDESQLRKIRQVWDRLPDLKAVVQYRGTPTVDASTSSLPVYSVSEWEVITSTSTCVWFTMTYTHLNTR